MRVKKRRFTAMLMAALLLAGAAAEALPPVNVLAADAVTVNMTSLGIPLLNAANYQSTTVKNDFLYLKNGKLNGGYKMEYVYGYNLQFEKEGDSIPANMSVGFNRVYKKKDNGTWWRANYGWAYSADSSAEGFRELMAKGDLRYELSGLLALDNHSNFSYHWEKQKDKAMLSLYQNGKLLKQYKNSSDDDDLERVEYGRGEWFKPNNEIGAFQVDYYHDNCGCGSSSVKSAVLAFADTTYPKITNVSTNGSDRYYNEGTFDITITFDESIRFADGQTSGKTADSTNQLVLDAYDRKTNRVVDNVTAQLVSLDGNKLTYRYTVPDNDTTDIVIRGVASADKQTMFGTDHDLWLYTSSGGYENIYDDAAYSSYATVRSPFTDLAGNSLADGWKATGFNGNSAVYVDTVAPEYSVTDISGSMMNGDTVADGEDWPEDIDRSQVFAGAGDTLTFTSTFNEEIDVDPTEVTAVLNIKDGGGNVTVRGAKSEAVSTGVNNNIKSTRITFETLTITSDMVPEDDASAIRIKTIELPSGAADLCGNEFANSTIEVQNAPRQQEWLDTVAPNVAASGATEEESYYGDGSEPVLGFRVFAQITDKGYDTSVINSANSDKYISGTNAVGDGDQAQESGVIILNNAAGAASVPYEYSVTTTPDAPTDGWQRAVTGEEAAFTQIDAGVYIHIRLTEGDEGGITDPVLTVMGYDYAGNCTTQETAVDIPLKDTVAPETNAFMQLSTYTDAAFSGNITASDKSGLSAVKYKIDIIVSESSDFSAPETPTTEEAEADDGLEWITAEPGEDPTSVDIFVPETQIEAGKNNCVYVHVYAADIFGNAVVKTYSFNYNLMLPSFTVTVPQGISDGMISISKLNKEEAKILGWTVEEIQNINFDQSMAVDPGDVSYIQSYGSLYVVVRDPVTDARIGMFVDDLTDANNEFNTDPLSYEPVSKAPFETLAVTDLLSQLWPTEDGNTAVIDAANRIGYFAGGMVWQGWGIDFENSLPEENAAGYIFEFGINDYIYGDEEYEAASKEAVKATAERFANHYGELEIYASVIDSKWLSQQNHNDEAEKDLSWVRFRQLPETERVKAEVHGNELKPVVVQKYTVQSARDDGRETPINTAVLTGVRDASGKLIDESDIRLSSDSSIPYFDGIRPCRFKTLSGIQVSFTVGNNRVPEWGVDDIDFENSYVSVCKDGVPVATQQLHAGSADQLFVLPGDIEYETGTYKIRVTLTAKVSGRVDETELETTLNVDATEADPNAAFKNVVINIDDPAIGELIVKDGVSDNTPVEAVTVPLNGEYQYIDFDSETIDLVATSPYNEMPISKIKMWISGKEDEGSSLKASSCS